MRVCTGFAFVALLVVSAVSAAAGTSPPAPPPPPSPPPLFACDFVSQYNETATQVLDNGTLEPATQTLANIRWGESDLTAGYWQAALDRRYPAGTRFRIDGQFPDARYFAFTYNAGSVNSPQQITDYQVVPNNGSASPFVNRMSRSTSIPPGGRYSVHIVYGTRPQQLAPNTIYVDPNDFAGQTATDSSGNYTAYPLISYRVYASTHGLAVGAHGNVPLPTFVEETPQGDIPVATIAPTSSQCQWWNGGLQNLARFGIGIFAAINTYLEQQPAEAAPIVPTAPVPAPLFTVYNPGVPSSFQYAVNLDSRYIYSYITPTAGDLVLLRGRAPAYSSPAGSSGQLRHWSVCENATAIVTGYQTYACVEDEDTSVDADGFFNIVISIPSKRPQNATPANGFQWLNFGTTTRAVVVYRQMLASPTFAQAAVNVPAAQDQNPRLVMGDYLPVATYCEKPLFDALTGAGQTPAQVFAACLQQSQTPPPPPPTTGSSG
ncbi:MAG: hypothetical protein P4L83_08240 [Nevskia sp.]|nr:hypothetical protein [Nevskia sp.]